MHLLDPPPPFSSLSGTTMAVVLSKFALLFILLAVSSLEAEAQMLDATGSGLSLMSADESVEWPSIYSFAPQEDGDLGGDDMERSTRRSLFWYRVHYYISYAALSANRVPCPPRSGRSYYTHNCYRARGPARPYSRNCEAITRCRR